MEFESMMDMCAYYTSSIFELVIMGVFFGFAVVTVLSFLAYGIFKGVSLLNVKR